jgi:hypothetical protein
MTAESDITDLTAGGTGPSAELHQLLAGLLKRTSGPVAESLVRAIQAELNTREARAYASGWQDAMEAIQDGPTA